MTPAQELDTLRNIVLILWACLAIASVLALRPEPYCIQHGKPYVECKDEHS
jgi:hypothetical protein